MTAVSQSLNRPTAGGELTAMHLPKLAPLIVIVPALAVSAVLALLLGWSWPAIPVFAAVVTLVALPVWAFVVEGRRAAVDRVIMLLVHYALLIALTPLVWVLATTIVRGAGAINWHFLSHDMTGGLDPVTFKELPGSGVLHAMVGSLLVTLGAMVISVPLGILTAIYLVEYGRRSWLARAVTILVDVMTGIPSIVAGLFALAIFTLFFGPGVRMGLMGSIALTLLMLPTVVRASEEMMRLVPMDLREASYALGVPKWRTILRIVIPTAFGGIVTGVVLSISRVIGETAPLLVTVGAIDSVNANLFSGPMETLPVLIVDKYNAGASLQSVVWGTAFLLIVIVVVLNIIGRTIGKIFAPASGR